MAPPPQNSQTKSRASRSVSWLLIGCVILMGGSCRKTETKSSDSPHLEQTATSEAPPQVVGNAANNPDKPQTPAPKPNSKVVRFITYNVENWLTMERYEDRKLVGKNTKPNEEKKQVIRILSEGQPDILGLCEVGTKQDLQEIQRMMKDAGVPLPHLYHSTGTDPVRSLGLLSRHPIVSTDSSAPIEYRLQGKTFGMGRGILDATVNADGLALRFIGVHLKSKRDVEEGDQELMRVNEARLLRQHVDAIFKSDPKASLVVYGDFNDTYPSTTVRTITSHPDPSFRLRPIYFRDSRREAWTHHWKPHDIYSRIDFVTLSASLHDRVDYNSSHIIDDASWDAASDHRPLLVTFR